MRQRIPSTMLDIGHAAPRGRVPSIPHNTRSESAVSNGLLSDLESFAASLVAGSEVPGCVVAAIDVTNDVLGCSSFGLSNTDPPTSWTGDTLFGLESITKIFTAIMFAQAIGTGELDETSYIDGYLPPGTRLRPRVENRITLQMLANYTSQLPN